MKLSQAQLGALLILGILISIFAIYKFWIAPKPKLVLKAPIIDTCYTNQPLKIIWDYRDYKGKVNLFFVSDSMSKKIGSKDNNPNEETKFDWKALDLKIFENKRGYIEIQGLSTIATDNFIILPPKIVVSAPHGASFIVIPKFSADGKLINIQAIDTLTNSQLNGIIYLNGLAKGRTNEDINTIRITTETTQDSCTGKTSPRAEDCSKNMIFITFSTNVLMIKVPGYNSWNSTPVQTVYVPDGSQNCNCVNRFHLPQLLLQIDKNFMIKNKIKIVPEKMEKKIQIFRNVNPAIFKLSKESVTDLQNLVDTTNK